jgi:hypothetical protein
MPCPDRDPTKQERDRIRLKPWSIGNLTTVSNILDRCNVPATPSEHAAAAVEKLAFGFPGGQTMVWI